MAASTPTVDVIGQRPSRILLVIVSVMTIAAVDTLFGANYEELLGITMITRNTANLVARFEKAIVCAPKPRAPHPQHTKPQSPNA